jgi:hypothetical protein
MTKTPIVDTRSEKGMALIVVLLLMAVLSGLATGFAMNGQVESTMAVNEQYYAGARAAAEAGINRATAALRMEENVNLLSGVNGLVDANPAAAVNADNGDVDFMLAAPCPCAVDGTGQYTYTVDVFDDDDPALYGGAVLSAAQLAAMGGEGDPATLQPDPFTDRNTRLILRATGFGPANTRVTVSRLILTTIIPIPGATVNPAILVDGDVEVEGTINLLGAYGSIHSNGDLTISGNSADIEGDATASGTYTATSNNLDVGGHAGGDYANINVPEITASDYEGIADYRLNANGTITDVTTGGVCLPAACAGDLDEWSFSDPDGILGPQMGTWEIGGNTAPAGTFFVEGKVRISGSPDEPGPGNNPLRMTLVATGSISITGSPTLAPDNTNNPEAVQFVTDGDLKIGGNAGLSQTQVEGQIFVKEQIQTQGTWDFRGRIIVQNDDNVFNEVTTNSIGGTPTITYDGTLPAYVIPPTTEFTYNVAGWIEQ